MSQKNRSILDYVGNDGEFLQPIAEYLGETHQEPQVPEDKLSNQSELQPVWFQEIDPSHFVPILAFIIFLLMLLHG